MRRTAVLIAAGAFILLAVALRPRSLPFVGIDWVPLPGGEFEMGSGQGFAEPRHRVRVRAFEIARTMVTNKQYRACVAAGACPPNDAVNGFGADDQPVVGVDWDQARAFSRWVGGRLPTEAEWEYAARSGGRFSLYPWGDEPVDCRRALIANCGLGSTEPVCSRAPGSSAQGLCDMIGNAWEWVEDGWHPDYRGAPEDGSAWTSTDTARIMRGGSWDEPAFADNACNRFADRKTLRSLVVGFRPVR